MCVVFYLYRVASGTNAIVLDIRQAREWEIHFDEVPCQKQPITQLPGFERFPVLDCDSSFF